MTPLALDYSITQPCSRSDYDIAAVYSYQDEPGGPLASRDGLDLAVLLHMRSFWQYHLGKCEDTFHGPFSQISETERPKMRKGNSIAGPSLSTSWLGYYCESNCPLWLVLGSERLKTACIHPLPETLEGFSQRESCADLEDHLEQVEVMVRTIKPRQSHCSQIHVSNSRQTLELKTQRDAFWPEKCNQVIPKGEIPDDIRTYFEGAQNTLGSSSDAANPLFGFLEPITPLYGGFKGWSRICFVIYERIDEDEEDAWALEGHWAHGYEAVILPGGSVMLGRWIDLNDATGKGPFIFWNA